VSALSSSPDTAVRAAINVSTSRIAGLAALVFAAGVIVTNIIMFDAPFADEDVAVAAAWYADNRTPAMIATGMVGITFPALLALAAAMYELARGSEAARQWMLVGAAGAAAMTGTFSIVAASQIAMVMLAESGSADAFAAAWAIHNATFAVNMTVLGAAFFGFSLGAYAAGLISGWQRAMGVVGALALLIAGLANAEVAEGSPVTFIGLIGFLLWLTWLVILGVRLVRR
jgi:hypothetical protein